MGDWTDRISAAMAAERGVGAALAAGVAAALVATLVRVAAWPVMADAAPFAAHAVAVLIAAAMAGPWAAVVATLASIVPCWWIVLGTPFAFDGPAAETIRQIVAFVVVAAVLAAIAEVVRATHRRAERLETALRDTRARLEDALRAGRMGSYEWIVDWDRATWDANAYRLWDVPEGTPITRGMVRDRIHPDDMEAFDADMARALDPDGDGKRDVTYRVMRRDGSGVLRWVHVQSQVEFDPETRRPVRMVGTNRDVSDVKAAEAGRELVIAELSHRVKNLFAVIRAILSLSQREAADPADAFARAAGRIEALGRAHSRSLGRGADDLEGLLAAVLRPMGENRFALAGPPVEVPADHLTPLGLILHELATNAAKHGALSRPDGRVDVRWALDRDVVRLTWAEDGGPPPPEAASAARAGFGNRMLDAAAQQLGGRVARRWTEAGLVVEIEMRLTAAPLVSDPA